MLLFPDCVHLESATSNDTSLWRRTHFLPNVAVSIVCKGVVIVFSEQLDALRCFMSEPVAGCSSNAWLIVCLYAADYLFYNYVFSVLVADESATFTVITVVLMTPSKSTPH